MKLIWLDLETTGLNPLTDHILEVAAFQADLANPFYAVKIYECVLEFAPDRLLGSFVKEMHTKNGLLAACAVSCMNVLSAERDLLRRIPAETEKAVLAGSSVHFDHAFIAAHMPELNERFSHRHYDVSAVKLFAQSLGMPAFAKAEAHRAAADVLESIEHAKACAAWLQRERFGSAVVSVGV